MKLNNKIKFMSCALVLISNFAWSQEVSKENNNCYVIAKEIIGTGGSPNEIIGIGGSPSEVIGTGGAPNSIIGTGGSPNSIIIGTGGITTYCTNEIIGHGGAG